VRPRSIKIVVASEYPIFRIGATAVFSGSSVRVVGEAASVTEAVSSVRRKEPDVLLMDLQLRGNNSPDCLTEIKSARPEMRIVIVASRERAAYLVHAINLGCSGFVTKEVTARRLIQTVRAVASGERVVEPALLNELLGEVGKRKSTTESETTEALSVTEREVLRLITRGQTNRQIAQALGYRLGTVKSYVQRIILKLGVADRIQAAVKAARYGLDQPLTDLPSAGAAARVTHGGLVLPPRPSG
jgi:DNA-binding NarL/FixJ family response regulator